ncbi:hypothetical protein ACU19_06570 [Actinobaculum suis]|uniref:glycosyltransferase family 4 protein n=1 Tax=Actinobaculum suis TaxID=1657 RepID=UPI00069FB56F|nr:glycosyltransferase family 4 protein [Actinobaculum suis]KMY23036.1 hypothetical protein ACU19_06570 [Actinobaculum suis]
MRVLGFGTYDVSSHPRVGIILRGLAEHGATVRELNVPLGIGTAGRVDALRNPLAAARFGGRLASCWGRLARQARRFRGAWQPNAVVVGYLGHFDVLLARRLFPHSTIVLDHLIFARDTAADRHLDGGLKNTALGALDTAALRSADIIVLDTPQHREMVPAELRDRAVVVPVGAPEEYFAARQQRQTSADIAARPPRIVFYGLYTPLQGAPHIARALALLGEAGYKAEVTMIGDGQERGEAESILGAGVGDVRVTWENWVDAAELPAVIARHDINLGIFGTSAKALRVVPNKVYQGMAAGLATVTSDTVPQREMLGEACLYAQPGNSEAIAEALAELLDSPQVLQDMQLAASQLADKTFHPANVATPLARRLGLTR